MPIQPYDFSKNAIQGLVHRCYDAADEGVDPNSKTELFAEIEQVAELLENTRKTASTEQIQEFSDTILHEIDKHGVGENHLFAEWIGRSDGAYKPLHHLFQAVAEVNGQHKALKPENLDSSGTLSTMQYIDEVAGQTRNQMNLLEQTKLQDKINEASIHSQPMGSQHLNVFGPKHKNNVMQKDLVEILKLRGIRVPESHGIETDQVLNFLKILSPQILTAWEKLGVLYRESDKKEAFLKNPEVMELLAFIDQEIQSAFEKEADEEAIKLLGLSEETLTWLSGVNERGSFLMTRSSGAEDTRKNANAGGNVSVAYVKPVPSDYIKSLGEVVRSYFSESSLKNRLNADLNPFEEPLKLAVTVQELMGEAVGGSSNPSDIPVSLVLFTNEPLYVGKEEFRVMRISASYGHGEGVVGNQGIATDTILILQSAAHPDKLHVLYDNQHKPERLAPVMNKETGKVELKKIQNSEEMATQPVLNENLIGRLFQWGVIGEMFFGDFQDMEIVIKGNVLHPVQSRPINRPEMLPTYLDLKKIRNLPQSPLSETIITDMIVPGKASVVEIVTPKEILLTETLEKAEPLFDKEKDKLVVVREPEGANTHPVVNFSSMGVPCLNAKGKKYDKVQDLAGKVDDQHHLAICMQAGTVSLLDTRISSIEDCTSKGFVVHPAKITISLPVIGKVPRKSGVSLEIPQEIKDFLLDIRTATTTIVALEKLNALKGHEWLESYSERIADLKAKKNENPLLKKKVKPILAAARSVEARVNEAFLKVEKVLNQPQEPGRMEFLFNVKILETILLQEHTEGSIGHYSVLNMQESFEAADAIIHYQKNLSHPAHFADVLMDGTEGLSREVFEDWSKFLLKLEPLFEKTMQGASGGITIEDTETFKATLDTLRKADVLPLFMTFFLKEHINRNPAEAIESINKLMPVSEKPLIEQLLNSKKTILQLRSNIATFGDPKLFPDAFNKLQEIMAPFLSAQQPWLQKDQWETTSPIARSIALQTMNDLVELYDSAIKSMKSSQEIKDIEKTKKFKEMLGPYFELLKGWAEKTVGKDAYLTDSYWTLENYLKEIEAIYLKLPDTDPNQQSPSRDFSVSAAVLGSSAEFDRHLPKTLEDVFTLIHQNLIGSTSVLLNELLPNANMQNSHLPAILKMAIETAKKIRGNGVGIPQQKGFDIGKTGITFYYNVPLRSHSGKFSLLYDKHTGKLTMEGQFLGDARDRWYKGAYRVSILDAAGIIPLQSNPKLTAQELTFKWDISNTKQLNYACQEYGIQAELSLEWTAQVNIVEFVHRVVSHGNLFDAALFVTKKNTAYWSAPFNYGYRREILSVFFKKMTSNPVNSIIESEDFFRLVLSEPNPIHEDLIKALVAQIKGDQVNKILRNFSSKHKVIIEQQLEHYKNESKFIGLLPTSAVEIWEALLSQGKGLTEAMIAIRNGIITNDGLFSIDSVNLLLKMIELDQVEFTAEVINFLKAHGNKLTKSNDNSIIKLWDKLLSKGQGTPEAIVFANQLIHSDNEQERIYGLQLFEKLIDLSVIDKEVIGSIAAAEMGMLDHYDVQTIALELWKKLLIKGLGVSEAITCATKGITHEKTFTQTNSLLLWNELISRGYGISEGIATAKEGMNKHNLWLHSSYLGLMSGLVKAGREIPEIFAIALQGIKYIDVHYVIYNSFKNLWRELLAKEQGIPEATDLANLLINSNEDTKRDFSIELLEMLSGVHDVPQEVSGNIAAFANQMILKPYNQEIALNIWKNFLAKGLGIDEAIPYATKLMRHQNDRMQSKSLELWCEIISRGYGISLDQQISKDIIAGCAKGMVSNNTEVQKIVLESWKGILAHGFGVSETIKYATEGIDNPYWEIRSSYLELMSSIVDTGQGIPEAITAAAKGIKDTDLHVRDSSLELWAKLKPLLKNSPLMQEALNNTLADWSYWNYAVPNRVTTYYSDYLASLSKLKSMMES